MDTFSLTAVQADYILDTKLRQLARLEEMKIRQEQSDLEEERNWLEKTLGSNARMKTLIKKELKADAEEFGDARRSKLVEREASVAIDETDMLPSEVLTVVLSQRGWVRAAKGGDIDAAGLNYKAGDGYLDSAITRSNQQAVFLDSTGRSYSLGAHTLPSARGQGEPLTGKLSPAGNAQFVATLGGDTEQWYLIASDAGYGFQIQLRDFLANKKAGKALLKLPKGAKVLKPQRIDNPETDAVVAITNEGRMLKFPLTELPALSRGKGNKIIGIPGKRVESRDEFVVAVAAVPENGKLTIHSGKRHMTLKQADLEHFVGERGRRGSKLPRGFQRVEKVSVDE